MTSNSSLKDILSVRCTGSFRVPEGKGPEQLSPPSGITCTPDGRLIVTDDFNHRIQIYDTERNLIRSFGKQGKEAGEFHYPKGTALDSKGNIYVADSWNHRVQKFDPEGNILMTIGSVGEEKGKLNEPYDVHVQDNGTIIVVERYNHRIQFFQPDGISLGWLGRRGTVIEAHLAYIYETPPHLFSTPAFEFPTSIACDQRGYFYITDSANHRVVQFDSEWNEVLSFGERGDQPGQFQYPLCVAVAPNGLLYVTDLNNDRIQVFTSTGRFLFDFREDETNAILKTPNLVSLSPDGRLHVGLTFNTRIFTYDIPTQPQETLLDQMIESQPKEATNHFHRTRLHLTAGDTAGALKAFGEGIRHLWLVDEKEAKAPEFDEQCLLDMSRLAASKQSAEGMEPALLKGLEILNRRLDLARQHVSDVHRDWQEVAQSHNEKLIEEQRRILEGREEPLRFNSELFEAEKNDRILFRKLRAASWMYRKTADQMAEYLDNLLQRLPSEQAQETCCKSMDARFNDLCNRMQEYLDIKEKHEEEMVRALNQEQDEMQKWEGFLIGFHSTRRILDLLAPFHFELRMLFENIKAAARRFPGNPHIDRLMRGWAVEEPGGHRIPKIMLGSQENWPVHNALDLAYTGVIDQWAGTHPSFSRKQLAISADSFTPVAYDTDDLNLENIFQNQFLECLPVQKTEEGLTFGDYIISASSMDSAPSDLSDRLLVIFNQQKAYDEKYQELFKQMDDLVLQKLSLEEQLKQVNPQDKKAPITINNNLMMVEFQTGLLRRMILTLEINEANNFKKGLLGCAILAAEDTRRASPGARKLFDTLKALATQLESSLKQATDDRKKHYFEDSRLTSALDEVRLGKDVAGIYRSNELAQQASSNLLGVELTEFQANRIAKRRNLLNRILSFQTTGTSEEKSFLASHLQFAFGKTGPDMGAPLRPMGLAHTPDGGLVVADQDNHQVLRFSAQGEFLYRFGGWGSSPGKMKYPVSVQADSRGHLFVVDMKNNRVQKFSDDGRFLAAFGNEGDPGQRLGTIFSACLDSQDQLWVADTENNRIQVYDSEGRRVRSITPGENPAEQFANPVGICCLKDGGYIIGDRSDHLLKHYSADGALRNSLPRGDIGFDEIYILTFDETHGLFASDFWHNQILHLDADLKVRGIYKCPGRRAGQFSKVSWLSVRNNLLVAGDYDNYRVQVFDLSS